jgi:hypothetical protein
LRPLLRLRTIRPSCRCRLLFRNGQAAKKGHPTRPQARKNRRRTLWGTLRILSTRERSWGPFSAAYYFQQPVSGRIRSRSETFPAQLPPYNG